MNLTENIRLAIRAIRSNLLRTILTLTIITLGIAALIGILTATEGIKVKMVSSFTEMGSNTFTIKNDDGLGRSGGGGPRRRKTTRAQITYHQAQIFKNKFRYPAVISINNAPTAIAVVKHDAKKTNPNVRLLGVDENYMKATGAALAEGRNFSKSEADNGAPVILLGKDVMAKIFAPSDSVIGEMVAIGDKKYKVIGLLTSKGASQMSNDNQVLIPVQNARRSFHLDEETYAIFVMVGKVSELNMAIDEATGLFRAIRKVPLGADNDFDISRSEKVVDTILSQLSYVSLATIVIGILTLIGAGIGLMNIMLVSVNERTREIGISKALGANKQTIRIQFLTEAILICQIGGFFGVILGVLFGNLVGLVLHSGFIFPWQWVIGGLVFTLIVGLAAGLYPAIKAAELDPVEALRYE